MSPVRIIECPRDAMQGLHDFIPTADKIRYLQKLLHVGFDTIDCGSFVSEKYIPQMRDTAQVLKGLDFSGSKSKMLTIIANLKGAEMACDFECVDYLGFPFSISEEFQRRNTNASMLQASRRIDDIRRLCERNDKELVVYISMAFGNPYGEKWDVEIAAEWVRVMVEKGIKIISMADTIGTSTPESIAYLMGHLIETYTGVEFGAHIHTTPDDWRNKLKAAYDNGCRRFDGAIKGFGGCPMAADDLVGNMPTEAIITYLENEGVDSGLDMKAFQEATTEAVKIFPAA